MWTAIFVLKQHVLMLPHSVIIMECPLILWNLNDFIIEYACTFTSTRVILSSYDAVSCGTIVCKCVLRNIWYSYSFFESCSYSIGPERSDFCSSETKSECRRYRLRCNSQVDTMYELQGLCIYSVSYRHFRQSFESLSLSLWFKSVEWFVAIFHTSLLSVFWIFWSFEYDL